MNRNLSTLATLHYVYGAFTCLCGLGLLALVGMGAFLQSDFVASQSHDHAPALVGGVFQIMGWGLFALLEFWGVMIILSGRWITQRRNRIGSLVVAGFCCLNIPLGLALGIFSFVTLLDKDVQAEYDGKRPAITA